MIFSIENGITTYEINVLPMTQLVGVNIEKKDFIIKSILKYFSTAKYKEYDSKYLDNIKIDGEHVGRSYFEIYHIARIEDVISAIKVSKTSLIMKYISSKLLGYNYQLELSQLEIDLNNIFLGINKDIIDDFKTIELLYQQDDLFNLIQKAEIRSKDGRYLEELSNFELLSLYLDIIYEMQKINPTKSLMIIENMDHMIKYEQYEELWKRNVEISREFDYCIVFTTSIKDFVIVDEEFIEGINVINEEIFILPELNNMRLFIEDNYPLQVEVTNEEILSMLRLIIQNIAQEKIVISHKSDIILKMINKTMGIDTTILNTLNQIENVFIRD